MNDFKLLKPVCLFEQSFDRKLRLNDTPLDKFAFFSCVTGSIGTAAGSSVVCVGNTRVICGIKVVVVPSIPDETISPFICNVEYIGLAQRVQRIENQPSKELQSLAVQLDWYLSSSALPDAKEQLLIHDEGGSAHAAYMLHVDIGIILDDGCLLDACLAAAVAALETASWPRLVVAHPEAETSTQTATSKLEFKEKTPSEMVRLKLTDHPVALSFAVVPRVQSEEGNHAGVHYALLCQPTSGECAIWDTDACLCHLVLDSKDRLLDCSLLTAFANTSLWQHLEADAKSTTGLKRETILQEVISQATKHAAVVREQIAGKKGGEA